MTRLSATERPRASVVVRTFDSASTVEATFRSLREQDVPVEVVVVDSGSSDGTLELAEKWADQVVRHPSEHFSFGGALNAGAATSTAAVVIALSSHSRLPSAQWVRTAVEHIDAGAVAACGVLSGPGGEALVAPLRADNAMLTANRWWGFTNHASAWSRAVWEEAPFDETLTATEDKEWSWRAVTGDRYLVVDPALVVPGDHRRDRGVRSYYRRLVNELVSVVHLRPVPAYSPLDVLRDLRRPAGSVAYLSRSRPWRRTRAVEVAARWRAASISARARSVAPRESGRRPGLSTLHSGGDLVWDDLVDTVPRRGGVVRWCWDFHRAARGREAVIVRGTTSWSDRYRDFLGLLLLRLTGNRARVVVSDATFDVGSAALERIFPRRLQPLVKVASRLLVRVLDTSRTTWCVLSSEEVEHFRTTWGLGEPSRVVLTLFCYTVNEHEWAPRAHDGGYLFSGGNSLRDYALLGRAVEGLGHPVRVATTKPLPPDLPEEVTAAATDHVGFVKMLTGCSGLLLPLATAARSTGQQTYLNAMVLGKPVVVTDSPGVKDHIRDGETGLVVDASSEGLRRGVQRLMAMSVEERQRLGGAARASVLVAHSPRSYRRRLLDVAGITPSETADDLAAGPAGAAPST